jgi:predicted Zn-dependent protease
MKKKDTFCVLGITNQDLYPEESDNFVFGEASMEYACGVFSFCRFK